MFSFFKKPNIVFMFGEFCLNPEKNFSKKKKEELLKTVYMLNEKINKH